ncbi:MAG: DUF3078 domain-containing protein [Bacteroidia bacterium]|nr:DUF3078 domain-containing protein [Bacteroidia bacterium]
MSRNTLYKYIYLILSLLYFGTLHSFAQVWRSSLYTPEVETVVYTDTALVFMTDLSLDSVYHNTITLQEEFRRASSGNYNVVAMELMVVPQPLSISYTPTKPLEVEVDQLQHSFSSLEAGDSIRNWINNNARSLASIREKTAAKRADLVKINWSEVPEPWKDVREGKRIATTDNDNKSLAQIFKEEFHQSADMRSLPKEEKGPWVISGEENLQMSQFAQKNWAKGGDNSFSLSSDMRAKAILTKDRHSFENNGVHKVGMTYTDDLGIRVSNDALELSSKYGFKAVNKWYYSFQTTLKTQMFRNYANNDKNKENLKSTLFSPAYIQLIFGMDYKVTNLSVLLSPYTASITIVADTAHINQENYGIAKDKRSSWVNGFSINTTWKKTITYGVTYSTKMELFYEYFRKDGQKRFNWENIIDMQINRFLTTRLLTTMRFFDNEKINGKAKFQFKENFTIAFKYTF